jgi:DNA-cytosine methyltransferase
MKIKTNNNTLKYLSLFSGIGGFELAIHKIFPNAECVGFSEIDKFALQVYEYHFPTHANIGDITLIKEKDIALLVKKNKKINLLVGGFPCQNLSSLSRITENCNGLDGLSSGLFHNMIKIIKWIQKYNPKRTKLHLLVENNDSMTNNNKQLITNIFQKCYKIPIYMTMLNGADFGVQNRKRLYWTTFDMCSDQNGNLDNIKCEQTWNDILEKKYSKYKSYIVSDNYIKFMNNSRIKKNKTMKVVKCKDKNNFKFKEYSNTGSEWNKNYHSDTLSLKSRCITRGLMSKTLIDRRTNNNKENFIIRYLMPVEIERLFWIPEGWTSDICSKSRCYLLLGNTVIVRVIEHLLSALVRIHI